MPKNLTRRSPSIPRTLLRERAFHLLPVYYLLTRSDLGREAVEHSGSHRFADHIYVGTPSGRSALGRWIDARLLAMPAARAFRRRCQEAQRAMRHALESSADDDSTTRILAVPCGIPRDLLELVVTLRHEQPSLLRHLDYHGMDIDSAVLDEATAMTAECEIATAEFHQGNALSAVDYPRGPFNLVVSTGLGEFLQSDELVTFYRCVHAVLAPGGIFFTSGTARDPRSDMLLRVVELVTQYRSADELAQLLQRLPWRQVKLTRDRTGLQTLVTAVN